MPIKRPPIVTGEIYHIVIKAVDGSKLFRDEKDNLRMISNLFAFNNVYPISSTHRWRVGKAQLARTVLANGEGRKLLVEILAFCFMSNHAHLLVRQLQDGGISKLMRKIGAGYGLYYNQKYKRRGHIFQGKYHAVHIKNDKQLTTVFVYIHTNPVAIICPKWKEEGIKTDDLEKVIKFLEEEYRWSSYLDYLGNKNFPSITSREFLIDIVGGIKEGRRFINDWLQFKKELADLDAVAIE